MEKGIKAKKEMQERIRKDNKKKMIGRIDIKEGRKEKRKIERVSMKESEGERKVKKKE